jgi:hypothetical protein
MRSPLRYEIIARTDTESYWSSHLFCGLYELVVEEKVQLQYEPRFSWEPTEGLATTLDVTETATGQRRLICVDWRDNADMLCPRKLAECDVYFKRNYIPDLTLPVCPPKHHAKLRTAGLSFCVRTTRERPVWVQLLGGVWKQNEPLLGGSVPDSLRNLRQIYRQLGAIRSFLTQEDFEEPDLNTAQPTILFQTKAYDPRATIFPTDTQAVTEQRAGIIRALQTAFGEQFIGGFVANDYAREAYPDCVSPHNPDQAAYCRMVKASRICVYTRGLRNSPAFKLGEYLAAARCIVAEPLLTELPQPLTDGRELVYFDGAEDLVAKCRALLDDPGRQQQLSAAAWEYYLHHVKPRAWVLNLLQTAFAVPAPAPLLDAPCYA